MKSVAGRAAALIHSNGGTLHAQRPGTLRKNSRIGDLENLVVLSCLYVSTWKVPFPGFFCGVSLGHSAKSRE